MVVFSLCRYVVPCFLLFFCSPLHAHFVKPGSAGSYISLYSDYGLYAGFSSLLIKFIGPMHVSMVRYGYSFLAQLFYSFYQIRNSGSSVQHGVMGVDVKIYKVLGAFHSPYFTPRLWLKYLKTFPSLQGKVLLLSSTLL